MLVVIKLAFATIKQKMNAIIKESYFKLLINNITFFILKRFFLKKIDSIMLWLYNFDT